MYRGLRGYAHEVARRLLNESTVGRLWRQPWMFAGPQGDFAPIDIVRRQLDRLRWRRLDGLQLLVLARILIMHVLG